MLSLIGTLYNSARGLFVKEPPPPDLDLMIEQLDGYDVRLSKKHQGIITKIEVDHLVIDNKYWLSTLLKAKVRSTGTPKIGDKVNVTLGRISENQEWVVDELVEILNDSDDVVQDWNYIDCEGGSAQTRVSAEVADVSNSAVKVRAGQTNLTFGLGEDVWCFAHTPKKGDLLFLDIDLSSTNLEDLSGCKIKKAAPARSHNAEGRITKWNGRFGTVDKTVYITSDVFLGDILPVVGDIVRHHSVECVPSKYTEHCCWRVTWIRRFERSSRQNLDATEDPKTKDLRQHKNGIYVQRKFYLGAHTLDTTTELQVPVENRGLVDQQLTAATFRSNGQCQQFSVADLEAPVKVEAGKTVMLAVKCHVTQIGHSRQLFVLHFGDTQIETCLEVSGENDQVSKYKGFYPKYQHQQPNRFTKSDGGFLVSGQKTRGSSGWGSHIPNKTKHYVVPTELVKYIEEGEKLRKEDIFVLYPFFDGQLEPEHYVERFQALLYLEEMALLQGLERYNMWGVALKRVGQYLALEVPGLAEKRPSLVLGDSILLRASGDSGEVTYEGCIHEVRASQVLTMFDENFQSLYCGETYNVSFKMNRSQFRRQHQAVELCYTQLGYNVLFPKHVNLEAAQVDSPSYDWVNSSLNRKQKMAVSNVLSGEARPLPYIIYGPPGTGKTVTVVETILQLFFNRTDARILVATPTNSSADLIAERLHNSGKVRYGDMCRLIAFQRSVDSIPECLVPYCFVNNDHDTMVSASRHRIVVSTCSTSAGLYKLGLSLGHFTHVIVDEAGHTTEPEALVPLGLINRHTGQIVLAGDPRQLGPVLQSSLAKTFGLELSLLERLTSSSLYMRNLDKYPETDGYNPLLVTNLVSNYRSHADIIEVPSRLFYHGSLLARAPESQRDRMCASPVLVKQGHPVVFHGVRGQNLQEADSPSWFNPHEAWQAVVYVKELLGQGVSEADIGVIAPYRQQIIKIKDLLSMMNISPDVKVGSVEEYQGQEKPVIILTTVRCLSEHVELDRVQGLGFMSSGKRFNVAVTRAQSLLIVVGDPHLLSTDPVWRRFLAYCADLGVYTGCDLPNTVRADTTAPPSSPAPADR